MGGGGGMGRFRNGGNDRDRERRSGRKKGADDGLNDKSMVEAMQDSRYASDEHARLGKPELRANTRAAARANGGGGFGSGAPLLGPSNKKGDKDDPNAYVAPMAVKEAMPQQIEKIIRNAPERPADAIKYFSGALRRVERERDPEDWARIQIELAELFLAKALGSANTRLDDDVTMVPPAPMNDDGLPAPRAATHTGKDFDNALFHFGNALQIMTPQAFRRSYCEITLNVARLLAVRADRLTLKAIDAGTYRTARTEGSRIEKDLEMAISSLEEVLYTYVPYTYPNVRFR